MSPFVLGREARLLGGEASPLTPPVDETLAHNSNIQQQTLSQTNDFTFRCHLRRVIEYAHAHMIPLSFVVSAEFVERGVVCVRSSLLEELHIVLFH